MTCSTYHFVFPRKAAAALKKFKSGVQVTDPILVEWRAFVRSSQTKYTCKLIQELAI